MYDEHADDAPAHDSPPAEPDYYAALGLTPAASADEVRRAYHRLAKLWHPDRFMHAPESLRERAGRRMRTLTAAYAVLGNAEERRAYDARRAPAGTDASHGAVPLVFQRETSAWGVPLGFGVSSGQTMGRRGSPDGGHVFFALLAGTVLLGVTYYALRNNGSQNGGILAFGIVLLLFIVVIWALASADGGQVAAPATSPADHAPPAAAQAPDAPAAPERTAFERLVDDALADVPQRFQPFLENVVVQVEPEPTKADLESVGVREGGLLLGLYRGVNLTRQSVFALNPSGPEEITIFQQPIEHYCHGDPERIRHQVLATVLHELAHHFGLEHEDMPEWVK
ncbi:MAG TPA: metallopeptidase family protein [Ktedonobacterales bacterium]|nr:metallopeptidase family protein [Ktedonobacterales bacterium]